MQKSKTYGLRYYKIIDNIFNIRAEIMSLNKKGKRSKFCPFCLETVCEHEYPKMNYRSTNTMLNYWHDIAVMESVPLLVFNDPENVVPKWPEANGVYEGEYITIPSLSLPLMFVYVSNKGEYRSYYENGEPLVMEDFNIRLSEGIYWGYYVNRKFYFLRKFKDGFWSGHQRSFDRLENLEEVEQIQLPVNGFWHIPNEIVSHYEFARRIYRV